MRLLVLLVLVLGAGATLLYLRYGTVEPCGILRERVREQLARDGGQVGKFVATQMPAGLIDGLMAAQYGHLSPGQCIGQLLNGSPARLP